MVRLENVLIKPHLTEKTSKASETTNRYGFIVHPKADKLKIRDAVEKFFDVKVVSVRTAVLPGKVKRSGMRGMKKTPSFKKAWVQIQEGQKIEFFKGI
jgi:large subunit ribosomal protein L23